VASGWRCTGACLSPKSQFYTTLAATRAKFVSSFGSARLVDGTASLTAYTRAAEPARLAYAVIGLAMGFGVEQLMNSMLFNAGGVNVLAYIVVVPSLFCNHAGAYVPAARASRIAPTQALRYE